MAGAAQNVVIVSGAAGNLGSAICRQLAAQNCAVVAVGRSLPTLRALIAALPSPDRHMPVADVDLTTREACEKVVAVTLEKYGRLDGVAATVGGFATAGVLDATISQWQQMFTINVLTVMNIFQTAVPPMRAAGSGSLVAIGAGAALRAPAGLAAYAASKAGVLRMVESFADELKPTGVRVNAVLPGIIDTPQNRVAMPSADHTTWVKPSQIAATISFLLSTEASAVTGAAIPVTGRS